MPPHTPEQLSHALSLLNTTQGIDIKSVMLELGISRPLARSILEDLASQCCPGKGYKAIRLGSRATRIGHKFSLGETGAIFSIVPNVSSNGVHHHEAPESKEEIQSAIACHEKSIANQRDLASTEEGWMELLHIFDMSSCQGRSIIRPAPEITNHSNIRRIARARMGAPVASLATEQKNGASSNGVKAGGSNTANGRKETTAAAFFAQKDTKQKPTEKKSGGKGSNGGKENNKEPSPIEAAAAAKEAQTTDTATSANVDDFQGDTDEDEDFLRQDQERKSRVAREARKEIRANVVDVNVKKRNTGSLNERRSCNPEKRKGGEDNGGTTVKSDSNEEEEMSIENDGADASVKKGRMDAFAKKNVTAPPAGGANEGSSKKRRKKLVEKTIMENGYLKTETVTVWEDVDEEEEAEEAKPSTSAKNTKVAAPSKLRSAPAKGKKQGNLMGFFQKK